MMSRVYRAVTGPVLLLVVACGWATTATGAEGTAPATRPTTAPSRKITLEEFERTRGGKDVVVLDVRSPKEYADGHVAGALNIPVSGVPLKQFDESVGKLDKEKTYLVHCARGVRSANAVARMEKLGFKHLLDFAGGMAEWQKAGKPVEKEQK